MILLKYDNEETALSLQATIATSEKIVKKINKYETEFLVKCSLKYSFFFFLFCWMSTEFIL